MKNVFGLLIFITVSIISAEQPNSKVVLKNGFEYIAIIVKIYDTAIELDTLNNSEIIMYSVIDSIITDDEILSDRILESNSHIVSDYSDGIYYLDFSRYKAIQRESSSINELPERKYFVGLSVSNPMSYTIMLPNKAKREFKTDFSIGFEFSRFLSSSVKAGAGLKYTAMDLNSSSPGQSDRIKGHNKTVSLLFSLWRRLYNIYSFDFGVRLGMGLQYSSQKYDNSGINNDLPSEYSGMGIMVELFPVVNYNIGSYQLYLGIGYRWSGFNYVYFNQHNRTSSKYRVNDYNSINIESGFGYLF